jgi:DNA modification methylase
MKNTDRGRLPAVPPLDPLKLELRPIAQLTRPKRRTRTHSDRQIAQLVNSIATFGFVTPVLIDAAGTIITGNARVEAARMAGMEEVPTILLDHLSPAEVRAYAIADNKLAANAGWNEEELRIEFVELTEIAPDLDLELTGFSTGEIDVILDASPHDRLEQVPTLDRKTVSGVERDDLWILGDHRLYCGDSRDPASFSILMGDEQARMVFSDPPYNVKIDGFVGGLGSIRHDEFAMAAGEMSQAQFTGFLATVFTNAAAVSIDGAVHYQCMDWRHMTEMMTAGHAVYSGLINLCVWSKANGGMGSFYRSQHELVFVWKVGEAPHLNNVKLGKHGRYRTNIWNYQGPTKSGTDAELAMHPTVKPVTMIMDAIKDASKTGEIVLDAFGGSGSTLIAAQKTRRRARLIEYEPKYCAVTIRRWEKLFRKKAELAITGETFEEVFARRNEEIDRLADAALADGEVLA